MRVHWSISYTPPEAHCLFYFFKIAHVSNWVIVIPSHLNKDLLSLCLPNNILLWRIFKHVFLWQHWVSIVARRNFSFPMWDLVTCSCLDTQLCPTLCDPMDCNKSGFLVLHHLQEFVQTHVHWVSDVIQPSHPLFSLSPPAHNLSQHQVLSEWISSSHQVTKVLELQNRSFR